MEARSIQRIGKTTSDNQSFVEKALRFNGRTEFRLECMLVAREEFADAHDCRESQNRVQALSISEYFAAGRPVQSTS